MGAMDRYLGKILNDKYEILDVIGIGGMSIVYKARDLLNDRIVAVKVLKEEFGRDENFKKRFINESRVIAMLAHKNIVDVYDVNIDNTVQYIVMEYVDGITLKQYMSKQGPLDWKESVYFTEQILNALEHAHEKGIIHRDIKPHNIMLLSDGTIKVADFGIARIQKYDTVTLIDKAIGTVHYISPEQASKGRIDERSDIYSIGIVLYEMVTGVLPFDGETPVAVALKQLQEKPMKPTQLNSRIPKGLEEIILKAICKNASSRFQSASEMKEALDKLRMNNDIVFGYRNLDESLKIEDSKEIAALKNKKNKKNFFQRHNMLFSAPVLAGIIAGIAVALGIYAFVTSVTKPIEYISVPNLSGMSYEEIINNPSIGGVFNIVKNDQESDTVEAGKIISQEPVRGTKIMAGATIEVYVSIGIEDIVLPDFTNQEQDEVIKILQVTYGLATKTKIQYDDEIAERKVITTEPGPGESIERGGEVLLIISGGQQKTVVPNVVGDTESEAIKKLKKARLNYTLEYEEVENYKGAYVIRQSADAGSSVSIGNTITIVIQKRKPEPQVSAPTESSDTVSDAGNSSSGTNSDTDTESSGTEDSGNSSQASIWDIFR